jgi:hypothetical protein
MEQPQKKRTGLRARGPKQLVAWIFSSALLVAALGLLGYRMIHPSQSVGPVCNLPARDPDPRKEIPNQQHLEAAREALARKQLAAAQLELNVSEGDPIRPPPPPPWELASRRFIDGELPAAMDIVKECVPRELDCRRFFLNLRQFKSLHDRLEQLTPRELVKLLDIESRITGPKTPSKLFASASPAMVKSLYEGALAAQAKGQWVRTIEFAQHVLVADPKHVGATRVISELRQKARDLYLQGYALKDANPEGCIARFQEVMDLTLPDDEVHLKAKTWLEKLRR